MAIGYNKEKYLLKLSSQDHFKNVSKKYLFLKSRSVQSFKLIREETLSKECIENAVLI